MDLDIQITAYVNNQDFKDTLNIPSPCDVKVEVLANGEYNLNYLLSGTEMDRNLVLRINTGSQMHLKHQIEYEYNALQLLTATKRTPRPLWVDDSRSTLPYGILVMEYLPGESLVYERDLDLAATILADIHSLKVEADAGLLPSKDPLAEILAECQEMFKRYEDSPLGESETKNQIRELLALGEIRITNRTSYEGYRCCINTELNSGNFLINGREKPNYLVDWEKPLYGSPLQDLGHFLAPTTTFWKTDSILSKEAIRNFIEMYQEAVAERFLLEDIESELDTYIAITCLRGITWCAMAYIEYQNPGRLIKNPDTYEKIKAYLQSDFLKKIKRDYYEV